MQKRGTETADFSIFEFITFFLHIQVDKKASPLSYYYHNVLHAMHRSETIQSVVFNYRNTTTTAAAA